MMECLITGVGGWLEKILPGLVYDGFVHSFDVFQVTREEAAITEVVDVTGIALGTCVDGLQGFVGEG